MNHNAKPQQHGAYQNSSGGCSSASSSVDLKCSQSGPKRQPHQNQSRNKNDQAQEQQPSSAGRSRSFLHSLGKHLGRHFSQHQIYQLRSERGRVSHMLAIYNSEEDVHSSSTDSFSLSYERHQHQRHQQCGGSSADLTGEERSSGASSAASAYSRLSSNTAAHFNAEMEEVWPKRNERHHYYLDTSNMYRRPVSALGHSDHTADDDDDQEDDDGGYSDNCQGDDRDADNDNDSDDDRTPAKAATAKMPQKYGSSGSNTCATDNVISTAPKKQAASTATMPTTTTTATATSAVTAAAPKSKAKKSGKNIATPPPSRSRSTSPCSISKGLHLSRISIASSVCRMFQHFSLNSSSSATTSTRSLSCSSTPLRGPSTFEDSKQNNNKKSTSHSSTNNKSNNNSNSRCNSKSTGKTSARSSIISGTSSTNSKKKEKKQQSILRPPVSYVYMKGMSGLYSRVPRYTVCCPYQAA